ncbi:sensor histidine kinase [Aerococcus viridans]|uniref:sensor histidine kinase n=1 Tax=Aerococcus TaxID=1375 RepID=UPI0025C060C4|nr:MULTISPECIES: sensor histidine kinase [unclassified Aerococcus]GMR70433.1 sensor histidine kinase [Aerococcus viridans]
MRSRRFLTIFLVIWLSLLTLAIGVYLFLIVVPNTINIDRSYLELARLALPFVYLLVINIMISLIASFVLYFFLYKDEHKLTAKLTALAARKYDSPIFQEGAGIHTSEQVDAQIERLRAMFQNMEMALQAKTVADEATYEMNRNELIKEERQRIARELHDSVSQQLFAMTMILSAIQEQADNMNPVNRQLIGKVADMVDQAQAEMRSLLLHLRPISLTNQSLAEGIEQLFRELETKVKINFEASVTDVQLLPEVENHLFRIVQELLSNSLRHAKAQIIECHLYEKDRNIYLRFSDDGVGFDTDKELLQTGGYGLKNIQERVAQLGGSTNIISFEKQGTLIQIVIPRKMEAMYD